MAKNEVYVTTDLQDKNLWSKELRLADVHWIDNKPKKGNIYQVRTRYRAPLVECTIDSGANKAVVNMTEEVRAVTPGQSAVLYDGDICLGGGIVV